MTWSVPHHYGMYKVSYIYMLRNRIVILSDIIKRVRLQVGNRGLIIH